jgi:hypothetical protein
VTISNYSEQLQLPVKVSLWRDAKWLPLHLAFDQYPKGIGHIERLLMVDLGKLISCFDPIL